MSNNSFAAKLVDPSRCIARVHDTYGVNFHQCNRNATIKLDGKGYCRQHDPVAVGVRQERAKQEWETQYAQKEAAWRKNAIRQESYDEMVKLLRDAPKLPVFDEAKLQSVFGIPFLQWRRRLDKVRVRAEKGM